MPYLETQEANIYYELKGKGTPIVFIHGLGSSTLDWEYQIPFFSQNFQTICIDLRGHGKSTSKVLDITMEKFAKDICQVIRKEFNEKCHIVGISMGGMVSFQLAINNPELIRSLTIVNSFIDVDLSSTKNRNALRLRKFIPRLFGMRIMGQVISKKIFPEKKQETLRKTFTNRWSKNTVRNYLKSLNAIVKMDIKNKIHDIQMPVFVIASEFDYTSIETKRDIVNLLPNASLAVLKNSRHAAVADQPKKLNELIFKFISTN